MRRRKAPGDRIGWGERALCWLFPSRCLLCGKVVYPGEPFCPDCGEKAPRGPLLREYPLPDGRSLRVICPFPYEDGFRAAVHRLKFHGESRLAWPMGRQMAKALGEAGPFDAVVWSPMSKKKRRRRDYDQSRKLAQSVGKALGLPCLPLLENVRETQTQHELSRRDREENVRGAYRAAPEAAGLSLLLVDDVVTTGATLRECAQALYRAGAKRVTALCAADAPKTKREREAEKA